jgi:hypothetical protein
MMVWSEDCSYSEPATNDRTDAACTGTSRGRATFGHTIAAAKYPDKDVAA